jgi:hypothetical protein
VDRDPGSVTTISGPILFLARIGGTPPPGFHGGGEQRGPHGRRRRGSGVGKRRFRAHLLVTTDPTALGRRSFWTMRPTLKEVRCRSPFAPLQP